MVSSRYTTRFQSNTVISNHVSKNRVTDSNNHFKQLGHGLLNTKTVLIQDK